VRSTTRRDLVPSSPPGELTVSVASAADGDVCVFSFPLPDPALPSDLTPAERDVVRCALRGMSNRQIARARSRVPRTVIKQLASAYRKLGIHSRSELAARYCKSTEPKE
jgi:DNA-binding CsgD family transcriptional regulator